MAERPPFQTAPTTWSPPSGLKGPNDAQRAVVKLLVALAVVVALAVALIMTGGGGDAGPEDIEALVAGGGVSAIQNPGDMPASLWVDAAVIGATVFLEGDSVGTVPLWLDAVAPGEYLVTVAAPGRVRADTVVQLAAGAMTEVELTLGADAAAAPTTIAEREAQEERQSEEAPAAAPAPAAPQTGAVRIVTAPAGATVTIDGWRVGRTPVVVEDLAPGEHTVEATLPGYDPAARQVVVPPGTRTDAVLNLRAQTGGVEVLVRPWGTIAIDGVVRQRETDVVFRTQLPVGTHTVRVSHPTFGVAERQVEVGRNVVYRLVFDLEAQTTQADAVGGNRAGW